MSFVTRQINKCIKLPMPHIVTLPKEHHFKPRVETRGHSKRDRALSFMRRALCIRPAKR